MFEYVSRDDAKTATALVDAILANPGHTISVNDGDGWAIRRSADRAKILEAMASTGEDTLAVFDANGDRLGSFWLIYGHGPGELIADHSDSAYAWGIAKRIA